MEAAAIHILREAEQLGHCCLPHAEFIEAAAKIRPPIHHFEDNRLNDGFEQPAEMPKMGMYYHPKMYFVEKRVAQRLATLLVTENEQEGLFSQAKINLEKWELRFHLTLIRHKNKQSIWL